MCEGREGLHVLGGRGRDGEWLVGLPRGRWTSRARRRRPDLKARRREAALRGRHLRRVVVHRRRTTHRGWAADGELHRRLLACSLLLLLLLRLLLREERRPSGREWYERRLRLVMRQREAHVASVRRVWLLLRQRGLLQGRGER
jgi:hypothetical protein